MTFTHALATNNYGPAKFIVSANIYEGTHTTIASALTSASSGDTIFIRTGSYTENLTLKAGVDLAAFEADAQTGNVNITGKTTFTAAGVVTISGIRFTTNSDFAIVVSGNSNSLLILENCYINCLSTGINFTSTGAAASLQLLYCTLNTGTGAGLFTNTATQPMIMSYCSTTNTGGSTTASTTSGSVNMAYCGISQPLTTSSAGAFNLSYCNINTSSTNTACLTLAGTGTSQVEYSDFLSGSASALSIGTGTTCKVIGPCTVNSSNTNAITGLGTIDYTVITYIGSSSTNNVSTQVAYTTQPSINPLVLQQIRATTSAAQTITNNIAAITTTPTTSTGSSILQVSITPSNTAHILLVEAVVVATSAGNNFGAYIIKNAAGNSIATSWTYAAAANQPQHTTIRAYFTAASVSAITFDVYGMSVGTNTFINANTSATQLSGGTAVTSLTVTEYAS